MAPVGFRFRLGGAPPTFLPFRDPVHQRGRRFVRRGWNEGEERRNIKMWRREQIGKEKEKEKEKSFFCLGELIFCLGDRRGKGRVSEDHWSTCIQFVR